jgi:hypothetical protein
MSKENIEAPILESNSVSLSSEDFDALFDESEIPEGNKIEPDNIIGGVKEEKKKSSSNDIKLDKEEIQKEKEVSKEVEIDNAFIEEEFDEIKKDSPKRDSDDSEELFFKAKVEHLIEKGIFFDFEGREDFEYTEENFLKLSELQADWKANEKYNQKVDSLGDYKVIVEYLEEGGNPDDIIEIFKESKELNQINTTNSQGKIEYLKRYYVDELGWTDNLFQKTVKGWESADMLDEQFEETKYLMEGILQKRIEDKKIQQQEYNAQQEQLKRNFQNSIETVLGEEEDLSGQDKKQIREALFNYNVPLGDGRIVNRFTAEFMKIQSNPKEYLDLIKHVLFKEKVEKIKEQKIETKANKKIWDSIKNSSSVKKSSSSVQNFDRNSNSNISDLKIKYK